MTIKLYLHLAAEHEVCEGELVAGDKFASGLVELLLEGLHDLEG